MQSQIDQKEEIELLKQEHVKNEQTKQKILELLQHTKM